MQRWPFPCLLLAALVMGCETPGSMPGGSDGEPPYFTETFEKPSTLPDGWIELNGEVSFTNGVLQLPAEPLEPHGVMFGPAFADGLRVAAKFRAEKNKRQMPTFSLGLNGVSGYRLRVNPPKKKLELLRNDSVVNAIEFLWEEGAWTHLTLEVKALPGLQWEVKGSVWVDGTIRDEVPTVMWKDADAPLAGRPTVWATPFAGKPVEVDDLRLWRVD